MSRSFNGTNQYLERLAYPVSAWPLTFACWAKLDASQSLHFPLTISHPTASYSYLGICFLGNTYGRKLRWQVQSGGAGSLMIAETTTQWADGEWQHAAGVTSSNTSHAVYLNGANKATSSTSIAFPSSLDRSAVGRLIYSNSTVYTKGSVLWPAIWDVALTDEEVASLAAGAYPPDVRPGNLVFFHPLGGFDGEHDNSILNGASLTAYNSPTWSQDEPGGLFYPSSPLLTIGSGGGGDSGLSCAQKMGVNCGSSFLWGVV